MEEEFGIAPAASSSLTTLIGWPPPTKASNLHGRLHYICLQQPRATGPSFSQTASRSSASLGQINLAVATTGDVVTAIRSIEIISARSSPMRLAALLRRQAFHGGIYKDLHSTAFPQATPFQERKDIACFHRTAACERYRYMLSSRAGSDPAGAYDSSMAAMRILPAESAALRRHSPDHDRCFAKHIQLVPHPRQHICVFRHNLHV